MRPIVAEAAAAAGAEEPRTPRSLYDRFGSNPAVRARPARRRPGRRQPSSRGRGGRWRGAALALLAAPLPRPRWGGAGAAPPVGPPLPRAGFAASLGAREMTRRTGTTGAAAGLASASGCSPPCMGLTVSRVISSERPWAGGRDRDRPRWLCATSGRTTLYPVGPRRVPDQHPTCVGRCEAGRAGPTFLTALRPWGTPVHARPAPPRAAQRLPRRTRQAFSTAPSGAVPVVT
jgi:hypothetical protein